MKEIILIAWRNLWRNKRRTLITVSSIFFALFYAILMKSFQLGTYNLMLDNTVTQYTGHLQIQDKEYFDNPSVDYSIPFTDGITNILDSCKKIEYYFPRIQTGALASSGANSKVAMVMGVDYDIETKLTGMNNNVVQFYLDSNKINSIIGNFDGDNAKILQQFSEKYFNNKFDLSIELNAAGFDTTKNMQQIFDVMQMPKVSYKKYGNDVLIGYKLAQYLELNQGDSIILIGQGFEGANAVGKYKIAGLLNFPLDQMNRNMIYMPISTTQEFLSAYKLNGNDTVSYVNYIAINTKYQVSMRMADYDRLLTLKNDLENKLNNDMLTVVGWRNLNEGIVETIQVGNSKGLIFIFILYLVISFGILGTVMMLLSERKKEFGMMLALGMRRKILALIISLEMFFMTLVSAFSAFIVTVPILIFGSRHPYKLHGDMAEQLSKMNMEPLLKFQGIDFYILDQVAVVLVIVMLILIYAVTKISKLNVINSLKS